MSLIADALKRAQEQRQAGGSEDKARRMLTTGPLRVETRDRPELTGPLALAVAALVVAAGVFVGVVVLAPSAADVEQGSRVAYGATPGADEAAEEDALDPGPAYEAGEGPPTDAIGPTGSTAVEGIPESGPEEQGVIGSGSSPRRRTGPGASEAGPRPGTPRASAGERVVSPRAETSAPERGPGSGVDVGSRGAWTQAGDESPSFRMSVHGGPVERTADDYFSLALAAQRGGDAERAISLYRSAIELRPDDPQLHNNLGTAYRSLSMSREAALAFEAAVDADPSYAPAWSNLGLVLRDLGRAGEAMEAFREALRRDPSNVGARVNLANQYQGLGMASEAVPLFREVLRSRPSLPEAHYGLGRALEETGRTKEAMEHYRLFLSLGRDRFPALEQRVRDHLRVLERGGG